MFSSAQLTGRVALVTGGGQGIGRAIVRRLLDRGARVGIVDVHEDAARDAADEYASLGEVTAISADVSDERDVTRAINEALTLFGNIDILVNNAAISAAENPPIQDLSLDEWERVIGINLTGPMLMAKHAAPCLRVRDGAIVNIASTRALQSEPNTEAYSASKGGLVALTHALAVSLGPRIRVNCISPGWIDTSEWLPRSERRAPSLSGRDHAQHPAGRVGRPEDVADLCALLVSDAAGFITGQNYVIDGGMSRKMIYED